jgi:hypothetical protein
MNGRVVRCGSILSALVLTLFIAASALAQAQIKISQVYGGSDGTNPAFNYDFIELVNNSPDSVATLATGFLLVHQNGTNPWGIYQLPPDFSMPPKTYYLIRCHKGGSTGADVPAGDLEEPTIDVPAGGVVAVFSSDPGTLNGCPTSYVDKVGYNNQGCAETASFPFGTGDSTAVARKVVDGSVVDNNDNSQDFELRFPNPHNGLDPPLPVQLARVSAAYVSATSIKVDWATVSEIDNFGFFVERKGPADAEFAVLPGSFRAGHGTSLDAHSYTFTDGTALPATTYEYRIKQVDLNGDVTYSEPVAVGKVSTAAPSTQTVAKVFQLKQNYPNPFNPETTVEFSVEKSAPTTLEVFNALGQNVATLFNEVAQPGIRYVMRFNGANLASGIYFCRLASGPNSLMVKMTLIR